MDADPRRTSLLGISAAIALVHFAPAKAEAFRCTRVGDDRGSSLAWPTRTVRYTFFAEGGEALDNDVKVNALRESFDVWENLITAPSDRCAPANAQTDFRWIQNEERTSVDRIGYNFLDPEDNENLIIFRDDGWPYPGFEDSVIALSTVTFNSLTGEILDADIEFNSANFEFTTNDVAPETDLQNAAVHEIGHSMGIAHTPDPEASMFLQTSPGQTNKRDLNCDDRAAMVFKYPANEDNGYCDPPVSECGFCARPEAIEARVNPIVVDVGDDVGGCGCHQSESSFVLYLLATWAVCRRRWHRYWSPS